MPAREPERHHAGQSRALRGESARGGHGSEHARPSLPTTPRPGRDGFPGTLVWDRGMVSKGHVVAVEEMDWQLICGLPKTLNAVQEVLDSTEVPCGRRRWCDRRKVSTIYAVETKPSLYGKERRVVVYLNGARGMRRRTIGMGRWRRSSPPWGSLRSRGLRGRRRSCTRPSGRPWDGGPPTSRCE